jgi:uncharacterized membrane protein
MIQTHVVNATLREGLRGSTAYQLISFIDGLVAPSFIFASGFVFAVALRRKLPEYLSFGPSLGRQVWRLLFVLIVGYVLHLPVFSLRALLAGVSPDRWTAFWAVDVLQCIAVTLLLMLGLLQVVRSERRLFAALPWIAAGIAFLTPLLWSVSPALYVPLPIATYLNAGYGSQFPLFPWSVFLLSGVIAGGMYLSAGARPPSRPGSDPVRSAIRRFVIIGAGMVAASFVLEPAIRWAYPPHDYWRTSPSFVILRLGLVMLLLSLCYLYEIRKGVSDRSVVALAGRESLLVYAAHLMLIFGDFPGFSFRRWAGESFGYGEAFIATAMLIALMVVLAFWWDRIRKGDPRRKRLIQGLALAGFVVAFVVSPG